MSESNNLQARNWAIFCHLSALVVWVGVPFGNILIPLLIWLIKKDEIPLVNQEGKESLNFQISVSIYALAITAIGVAAFLARMPETTSLWLMALVLIALAVTQIVLVIIAAFKASSGERFMYPLAIRFIK